MPPVGRSGDLYLEQDKPPRNLEQPEPPSAPAPVPPPVKPPEHQPIQVRNHRMADERPDGSIRDTSTEALRNGNDLGFRNISDEELGPKEAPPPAEAAPPAEAKPEEKPAQPVVEEKPIPEKIYAGKFKTPEELEKGYLEAQKLITKQGQEKAELAARAAAQPPAPPVKTPQQLAAEQEESNRILTEFAANPKEFIEKNIVERTMVALTAQQTAEQWRKVNPDLAEHEVRVAFEATLLAQSDPELARNPAALLNKATDNFRQFTGKIRTEGAKEALTQETRVIPLVSSSTPPATEQPATKAPLTTDEAYSQHLNFLKEQEKRSHRGLRR
jgi:hypothetical protein